MKVVVFNFKVRLCHLPLVTGHSPLWYNARSLELE